MNLARRKFLHLAAGAAALPGVSHRALALDYPSRPAKILVGFPAGGAVCGRLHAASHRSN